MTPLTWTLSVSAQLLLSLFSTCSSSRPTYIITAPRRLFPRVNMTFTVCPLQDGQSPLRITARISKAGQNLKSAEGTFHPGTIGRLVLPTEDLPESRYELVVQGHAEGKLLFSNSTSLEVIAASVSTLIQTDKAIYKPGHTVKIRTISIYPDLKPYLGKINVIIHSPQRSVIQQWLDVETTLGVVSKEFPLSSNSPLGDWNIQVTSKGVQREKTFTVAEYVFSRFEVFVNTSSVYLPLDQTNLTGTIAARYLYGKPVKGNVSVSISLSPFTSKINKTFEMNGSADFIFTFSEMLRFGQMIYGGFLDLTDSFPSNLSHQSLMEHPLELLRYQVHQVTIKAAVTESHTGVMQIATANVTVSFVKYKLEILSYPRILKPPLNFTTRVQVSRFDHRKLSPQDRKNILVVHISQMQSQPSDQRPPFTNEPLEDNGADDITWERASRSINLTVPENGIVKIQFPLLPRTVHLWIKVTFEKAVREFGLSGNLQSSRRPFIQLYMQSSVVKVGLPFEFAIESSELLNEITYQVVSKGQLVAAGKSKLTTIQLTPEVSWAPLANLIAYYVQEDGQVVSDALDLNVEGIFANKVSLSWSKDQAKPADNVTLSVSANDGSSFVGILVVDKGVQLLKGGNDITEDVVIQELEDAITEYIAQDIEGIYDANVFQDSGLMVLTDAHIPPGAQKYSTPFDASIQLRTTSQPIELEDQRVRTYFPETWIWLDMFTGPNSNVSFQKTVPDSLTTWIASAFAISKSLGLQLATVPAQLEVFKSFFLELNLPYSVTRGEQLILEINIYNYLQQTLEVWVTLEPSDSFDFTIVPDERNIVPNRQTASVLSQDVRVFYFPIKPKGLGLIPLTVKATSEAAHDAVTKSVLVKAEGIQQSFSQALLVAPDIDGRLWSEMVQFTFPEDVVDGSQSAQVTVIGDILGPSINGFEDLLQMPYGCGEQNMIRFAPNIYILQYLTAINQVNQEIEEKALTYMIQGYQRELTYRRDDGSFSAFGNSDSSGSTWLSAFVLRCFFQAQGFIYIDTGVLNGIVDWIMSHQNTSGEFWEPGRVLHTELQGGQNGPTSLTAYVLTALLEDRNDMKKVLGQVSQAVLYLEGKLRDGISSNYTLSLVTYALTLANSSYARKALDQLNQRADQQAGVKFWSSPTNRPAAWWGPQLLAADIEVAAYALLSYLRQNRLAEGIPVMQWLSQHRNHLGGFCSTQDTVVALQALSQFAARSIAPTTDLALSVSGPGLLSPAAFNVTSSNAFVLQAKQIGIKQHMLVTVTAQGQGMAIFQLNILFNLESKVASKRRRSVGSQEAFDLDVDVIDNKDDLNHVTLHLCTRFLGGENSSSAGMVLMEVGMLSGFVPETDGIQTNDLIKKVEFEAGKVNLYFDLLNETEVCVTVPVIRDSKVANAQDAVVSVFEYYEPGKVTVRTYNSEVMSNTDSCSFCGFNCSLCRSNVSPQAVVSAAPPAQRGRIALSLCLLSIHLSLS
ncbi:CD109 antigen [Heptranchias perlo]|uniref:CD109 antigen n=1 Tax=Heptranchias perlo TaxID=212740 RepID=UPI0035595403